MSAVPLITFKAGRVELVEHETQAAGGNVSKLRCDPTPGYLYVYVGEEEDDDFPHFCWRPRSKPAHEPEMNLIMFPGDASFTPYTGKHSSASSENVTSPTDGRIYALKFTSSSQRHFFWLQSKSQKEGQPNWFSSRDLKLGQIVDLLISGEEVDVQSELQEVRTGSGSPGDDDDHDMEDVPESQNTTRYRANSTGGAGAGATGGDVRDEGEEAREGGADGGRAAAGSAPANDPSTIVQNFLKSLGGGQNASASSGAQQNIFTTLGELLTADTCIPVISSATAAVVDNLISYLPPAIILLETRGDDLSGVSVTPAAAEDAIKSLSLEKKKSILLRVIRSPQLHQSLGSLTMALRDGGLPTVAESLKIDVENGGYIKHSSMPLGGGDAVEAFLKGVERTVKEDDNTADDDTMDTS